MQKMFKIILIIFILYTKIHFAKCSASNANNLTKTDKLALARRLYELKDEIAEAISPYVTITIVEAQPKCVKTQCKKYVCLGGKFDDLLTDIKQVEENLNEICDIIEELHIYNYSFPQNVIPPNFLQEYAAKVERLFIFSSYVSDIAAGAFANGCYKEIYLEDLKLKELRKDFFENITARFEALTVIQMPTSVESIEGNFLNHVKYKIKYLTLQVGINDIQNIITCDNPFNNLAYVNFSYNNISDTLTAKTFNQLSVVQDLNLSHSNISFLPAYIFAQMSILLNVDLSYNKLTTITNSIIGFRNMPLNLVFLLNDNPWNCTCELQHSLNYLFMYQKKINVICETPAQYKGRSAFDERICNNGNTRAPTTAATKSSSVQIYTTTIKTTPRTKSTTVSALVTDDEHGVGGGGGEGGDDDGGSGWFKEKFQLKCTTALTDSVDMLHYQNLTWPRYDLKIVPISDLRVHVDVAFENLHDSYGLLWFSKVNAAYDEMEINYNEYGLGCYRAMTQHTIVNNMTPDTAYTFCVVRKDESKVAPLNCKSIHISRNIEVSYDVWLTNDKRVTGISLVIVGIVMFTFLGIIIVFVLLRQKPILLVGSKRVALSQSNSSEIIVLPKNKTIEDFRLKEQILSKRCSGSTTICTNRRSSLESIASYQSYMNGNLYEMIPAYLKLQANETSGYHPYSDDNTESPEIYSTSTLSNNSSTSNLVNYAQIPHPFKRTSRDPLPEIPQDQTPLSLPLIETTTKGTTDATEVYVTTVV